MKCDKYWMAGMMALGTVLLLTGWTAMMIYYVFFRVV